MIAIHPGARLFLYGNAVDMRKSFEGLSALVESAFPGELLQGWFIFLNRSRDRTKILYWDEDGFVIWYKRLEKGSFLRSVEGSRTLNRRDFFLLLEGVTPKKMQKRFSVKKP